jgi:hypothetical protein
MMATSRLWTSTCLPSRSGHGCARERAALKVHQFRRSPPVSECQVRSRPEGRHHRSRSATGPIRCRSTARTRTGVCTRCGSR